MSNSPIREKARYMFVEQGLSMQTIIKCLEGEVSRKTLYNWRKEDNWEEERKSKVEKTDNLRIRLENLLQKAITDAETNFNASSVFAIGKLVAAIKSLSAVSLSDESELDDETGPKDITKETIDKIRKEVLGLED